MLEEQGALLWILMENAGRLVLYSEIVDRVPIDAPNARMATARAMNTVEQVRQKLRHHGLPEF